MQGSTLLALAARGDVEAQRQLCQHFIALSHECPAEHFGDAFAASEIFARLAAAHGDPVDIKVLAGTLFKRGEWAAEKDSLASIAEGIALLDQLSANDEEAALALDVIASLDGSAQFFDLAAQMILTENPALEVVAGVC